MREFTRSHPKGQLWLVPRVFGLSVQGSVPYCLLSTNMLLLALHKPTRPQSRARAPLLPTNMPPQSLHFHRQPRSIFQAGCGLPTDLCSCPSTGRQHGLWEACQVSDEHPCTGPRARLLLAGSFIHRPARPCLSSSKSCFQLHWKGEEREETWLRSHRKWQSWDSHPGLSHSKT